MKMVYISAIVSLLLATSVKSELPLEADEILALIEVPDEDGTEGKTMDEVIFDAKTEVRDPLSWSKLIRMS